MVPGRLCARTLLENDRVGSSKGVVIEKHPALRPLTSDIRPRPSASHRPWLHHLRPRLLLRKPVVVNPRLLLRYSPNRNRPDLRVHEGIVVDQDLCTGYVRPIPSVSATMHVEIVAQGPSITALLLYLVMGCNRGQEFIRSNDGNFSEGVER